MPILKEVTIQVRITKSANYQSGAGEAGMTIEVLPNETTSDILDGEYLRRVQREVMNMSEALADEALDRCPRRK